jgi:DNA-binding CsgD family transcriptional regulator
LRKNDLWSNFKEYKAGDDTMSHENITFYPSKTASLNMTQLAPLVLSACGHSVKVISYRLSKADPTINHHLVAARQHYGARNNAHAIAIAIAYGDIKFKIETSYASTLRCSAFLLALLAGFVSIIDTPFVGDANHSLVRTTRHVRGHKGGRRDNPLDLLIV